ncbi:MAG: hypothetical protein AAFX87_17780 [Bacteroidota bacterium]
MTPEEFKSLTDPELPNSTDGKLLKALWHDGQGDWDAAHNIAQDIPGQDGAWVHAYLHRKEGDEWNANYWYTKAGKNMPKDTLAVEWQHIVEAFLSRL